jgi:2-polyprenyl-6-methoxyphenol hydroxylase-like FAD-dependent oxidoreductase
MRKQALVLGGSMAGLLAARVLSDYFDRVTILDRDVFPPLPKIVEASPGAVTLMACLPVGARRWNTFSLVLPAS